MYECHDLRSGLILKPHIKLRESLVMAEQTQCDQVAFMLDVDWRRRPPFPIRHQIFCSTFNHDFFWPVPKAKPVLLLFVEHFCILND